MLCDFFVPVFARGTDVSGLTIGLTTDPQSDQGHLMVIEQDERTQVSFGVSKSVKCDTFSLQYSDTVGWATGRTIRPVKQEAQLMLTTGSTRL